MRWAPVSVLAVGAGPYTFASCEGCRRKVELSPQRCSWRCPRCGHRGGSADLSHRFRLRLRVADGSGAAASATLFGPCLEVLFGASADEFARALEALQRVHSEDAEELAASALAHGLVGARLYLGFGAPSVSQSAQQTTLDEVLRAQPEAAAGGDGQLVAQGLRLCGAASALSVIQRLRELSRTASAGQAQPDRSPLPSPTHCCACSPGDWRMPYSPADSECSCGQQATPASAGQWRLCSSLSPSPSPSPAPAPARVERAAAEGADATVLEQAFERLAVAVPEEETVEFVVDDELPDEVLLALEMPEPPSALRDSTNTDPRRDEAKQQAKTVDAVQIIEPEPEPEPEPQPQPDLTLEDEFATECLSDDVFLALETPRLPAEPEPKQPKVTRGRAGLRSGTRDRDAPGCMCPVEYGGTMT